MRLTGTAFPICFQRGSTVKGSMSSADFLIFSDWPPAYLKSVNIPESTPFSGFSLECHIRSAGACHEATGYQSLFGRSLKCHLRFITNKFFGDILPPSTHFVFDYFDLKN